MAFVLKHLDIYPFNPKPTESPKKIHTDNFAYLLSVPVLVTEMQLANNSSCVRSTIIILKSE